MRDALARHDEVLRETITEHGGYVFKTIGDAFCAAFATAPAALEAALAAQVAVGREAWPAPIDLRVRMALHTGAAQERDGDYFGPTLNRVARLLSAGHGGQTLLSEATQALVRDALPEGASLIARGEHRLKDLARSESIFQLSHPSLGPPDAHPALKTLDLLPNNLPRQVTSFIGREKEMADVRERLGRTRLLTLTGSGGTGKTRLAYQIAADLLDPEGYPDGVWVVELAAVTDPALIPQTVAAALGIRETRGEPILRTLTGWLRDKRLLLVVDNCEHALDACARLADEVLRACPEVRLLATSREPLGVAGESVYRVPSLALPDAGTVPTAASLSQYEAAKLFIERAEAARADFAVTNANAPALAEVCYRLDGIPLAIELAAARTRSLTLEELNRRLDDRFRLLTGGSRAALPRQQTLRALIDWSYDLLEPEQKTLLARLSAFRGGWTLDAAERVCAGGDIEDWAVLDLLGSLVDKSLVQAEAQGPETRYRLLETVHQYAREKLAAVAPESTAYRERHRDHFLALAEQAEPRFSGPEQRRWLDTVEGELDNLRQAMDGCASETPPAREDREAGMRLAAALETFWSVRGYYTEGRQRLERALDAETQAAGEPASPAIRAKALHAAGFLATKQGDPVSGQATSERAVAAYREIADAPGLGLALMALAEAAKDRGELPLARTLLEEAMALARERGNGANVARAAYGLGGVAFRGGDFAGARTHFEQSLTGFRQEKDVLMAANALQTLGMLAAIGGDYPTSRSHFEACLAAYRELGYTYGMAMALHSLGNIALDEGDFDAAGRYYEEALALFREMGNRRVAALALHGLGHVAYYRGDYAAARGLYEESLGTRRETGSPFDIFRCLQDLGTVAVAQGDHGRARLWFEESLTGFREYDHPEGIAPALEGMAAIALADPDARRCAVLLGAAHALRESVGTPVTPVDRPAYDRNREQARAALGDAEFAEAWETGGRMPWEEAAAYALSEAPAPFFAR